MEDEVEITFSALKEEVAAIGKEKKKVAEPEKVVEKKGKNYLLKSIRRIP